MCTFPAACCQQSVCVCQFLCVMFLLFPQEDQEWMECSPFTHTHVWLTIVCPYPPQHRDNRKFFCKGDHRNKCTDMVTSQSRFAIEDNGSSSSFSVTITKIQADDTGTYWCGSDSQWSHGNYTRIQGSNGCSRKWRKTTADNKSHYTTTN
uniref:Immunoglobulin V-set domain-containing protein n=1 Tax=Pundamilia nyererei TaxID=303518 RepID=A0A3B4F7X5_9CICH